MFNSGALFSTIISLVTIEQATQALGTLEDTAEKLPIVNAHSDALFLRLKMVLLTS